MAMSIETIDNHIDQALRDSGFFRAQKFVYKAWWSTHEVVHFVYIGKDTKRSDVLASEFGLRNDPAEIFSCNAIRTYGGDLFKSFKCAEHTSCMMRFSFSRIDPERWTMHFLSFSDSQFKNYLHEFINNYLVPSIGRITTLEGLLALLTSDMSCCPWSFSNGAIRAAQIVALTQQMGLDADHVRRLLEPRLALISRGFAKTSEMRMNPTAYIDRILNDWTTGALNPM